MVYELNELPPPKKEESSSIAFAAATSGGKVTAISSTGTVVVSTATDAGTTTETFEGFAGPWNPDFVAAAAYACF